MTVAIAPLGEPGSEAALYAEELHRALGGHAQVNALLAPAAHREPADLPGRADVTHVIAPDGVALLAWRPFGVSPIVATVLHGASGRRLHGTNDAPAHTRAVAQPEVVVTLTRQDAEALYADGVTSSEATIVPCWAPGRALAVGERVRHPGEAFLLVLSPDGHDDGVAEAVIGCLPGLPVSVGVVIAFDPTASGGMALAARWEAMALAQGTGSRVATHPVRDGEALEPLLDACAAVVAQTERSAGVWHCLSALAYGKPLLAPDLPIFRDVMVRGACVRILRPREQGHVSACVRALLANPIGMAEMQGRAVSYARSHGLGSVADRMAQIYLGAHANGA